MKKQILILSLGLYCLNTYAQDSFLNAVWPVNPVRKVQLLDKIRHHAELPKSYLSLGETHLESDSVLVINQELTEAFYNNAQNSKITFCSETLSHFLESDYGMGLQDKSFQVKIFEGNGPSRTDFNKCEDQESEHYYIYSGNFHQYPFARPFPGDFPKTSVITSDTNNIRAQMPNSQGLFVTQQELIYLEGMATRNLLNKKITDLAEFKSLAATLIDKVTLIKSQFEILLPSVNRYEEKLGIILDKNNFKVDLFMDDNSFQMITDRSYRPVEESFHFFRKLMLLEKTQAENLLKYLSTTKFYVAVILFSRGASGESAETTYIGIPYSFDGLSQLIQTEDGIILSQPQLGSFECFDKNAEVISCDLFLGSTPPESAK